MNSNLSPYLNAPNSSQAPQPRAIVLVNGINVLWHTIEVTTTTFYMSDSYSIELPMSSQPKQFDFDFLASQFPMTVEIYMGFPANPNQYTTGELKKMIVGQVDRLEIDPLTRTVRMEGRDLTSVFIDTKTYNKYVNQTASDIAILLAKEHGLGIAQIVPTTGSVGTFYTYQNTLMSKETTEWDLLTFLAQNQDYVVYVSGNDLVFKPRPTVNNSVPFVLNYQAPTAFNGSPIYPGMALSVSRSLTLADDVTVLIRVPVNPQTGNAFTQRVSRTRKRTASQKNQVYTYTFTGLNPQQALQRGQQILNDITLHELKLQTTIPGEIVLQKDSLISLTGTGTSLDQIYYTDMIVRTMSIEQGFEESISAKNHSVDSQVVL